MAKSQNNAAQPCIKHISVMWHEKLRIVWKKSTLGAKSKWSTWIFDKYWGETRMDKITDLIF
jgi:hypothetical protein